MNNLEGSEGREDREFSTGWRLYFAKVGRRGGSGLVQKSEQDVMRGVVLKGRIIPEKKSTLSNTDRREL